MKSENKYIKIFFLIILMLVSKNFANVDMFGYFESEGDYMMFENDDYYFGYNKFRLDLLGIPGDKVEVGADIVYKNFNGKTTWNLMNFIPEKHWPINPHSSTILDRMSYLPIKMSDTLFLDNVYLKLDFDKFRVLLGRQQISTGVGYAWNPTDIFNKKDIMDPTYEQTGIDAITMEIPIGLSGNFTGILQLKDNWENTTKYLKYKQNIGQFDISLSFGQRMREFNYFNYLMGDFREKNFIQEMVGGNIVGEFLGLGVWSELGIYSNNYMDGINSLNLYYFDEDKYYNEYVVGIDYTFKNSLYIMGEYFHTDVGIEIDELAFDHYLNYFQSNVRGLNQNYLFTNVMYPLTDSFTIGAFNIANLDDQSVVFNPQIKYLLNNNVEINFIGSIFYGESDTEFGTQDYNFRLRLKAYF